MIDRRVNRGEQDEGLSIPAKAILIALVFMIMISVPLFFFYPQFFNSLAFQVSRVKNAFSYYVLQDKPEFYYLEMEKNGKDIRVSADIPLEVTYRDEFVVKSVVSDDLTGKYTTVQFEGFSKNENDLGILLKGIDIVNKIIKTGTVIDNSGIVSDRKILINYRNEKMADVPLKIDITPQDWFRFAKDSANVGERIEYLKKAIEMNKNDVSVREVLAGVYLRQGRINEAISQYKDVLSIKPDDSLAMEELVKCYIKKNEFDEAIKVSKGVIKNNPKSAQAYVALGLSMAEKGLWAQAAQSYHEAVRLEPDDYLVRFKLAEAYENGNMINSAIDEYKYIAAHSKEAGRALLALGNTCLKQKKYDEAAKYYNEVLEKQPRNAVAYANLAAAYAGMGKWSEELDNLKKAVSISPREPAIHFNLGAAYERRKMNAEAIREYEYVLKINPADADALERLADMAFKNKQFDQAVKYYEKLKIRFPQKASIYANLGFAYGELKNYAISVQAYEKAIKYGAKDSNIHYNLAYTFDKLGMEKQAIAEYEKTFPLTKQVLSILAHYYLKEKNYVTAIKYYKKIMELEPKKASSYESLGYAYAASGNWDTAIKNYRIALRYDREDDELYANLGEAYERKGLYPEALKAYDNAYALNPESAKAAKRIPRLKIKLLQEKAQKKTRSDEE
ncbi:MAG TPA: tetratricopeptide repeat protein [Smithella sp.]|nr:tetratricopeptide repeat protein [Smithella sp.]